MKKTWKLLIPFLLIVGTPCWGKPDSAIYTPDLQSLTRHNDAPEWFRDAKLGIYFHWGIYSVPAFGSEWYPRDMHIKGNAVYRHHVSTYGEPTAFGYHDFVPLFKAEQFDAEQWAALFKRAGARFAGPVAEHHDGFSMWDSRLTPWNVKDKGPRRDITGELEKAVRKYDMRFITTFHHARNNLWEKSPGNWTGHYEFVKKDFPSLLDNAENAFLYGYMPRDAFVTLWKDKLKEVIDGYRPDIIWFDSWLDEIPQSARFEFAAYYFNRAAEWNKEVVIVRKQDDMPLEFSVLDHEKSRTSGASDRVWMTDDTVSTGSWCYTNNLRIKSPDKIVHALADTVSKNGVVLLNISPKADGTIPADQQQVLMELGDWLTVNGEAIYDTRPWETYGEGPTKEPAGGFSEAGKFLQLQYSAEDIRYTRSKDGKTLYAICLGWPQQPFTLKAVAVEKAAANASVSLLGRSEAVPFTVHPDGSLTIAPPRVEVEQRPCRYACVFRLDGFDIGLDPRAGMTTVTLAAEQAVLNGSQLRLETRAGRSNIGYWDNPEESVHWLIRIREAGRYTVWGDFALAGGVSHVTLSAAGQQLSVRIDSTGGWDSPRRVELGHVNFPRPGVYHVVLGGDKTVGYSAVNVWGIQFEH